MRRALAVSISVVALGCSLLTNTDNLGPSGAADAGPDAILPPGCDPTRTPSQDLCVVDNALGVFVDGDGGNDLDLGTRTAPFKTLTKAATAAAAASKRIYACVSSASYGRATIPSGVAGLFGQLSCKEWKHVDQLTRVAADATAPALTFAAIARPIVVEGISVTAAAGTTTSPDSVAVLVSQCADVTFKGVAFQASPGSQGPATPALVSNYSGATAAAGKPETMTGLPGVAQGDATTCTCNDSTKSTGGNGAGASGAPPPCANGTPSLPTNPAGHDGLCGPKVDQNTADPCSGHPGADGAPAAPSSVAALPTIDANGLVTRAAKRGGDGTTAQGGGGGGNTFNGYRAGGGGACGGCGGRGGAAGASGGSSIALLVFQSTVRVDDASQLLQDTAADGQAGVAGELGQSGGVGGSAGRCPGGAGGKGGDGTSGGGGAGGISAAVAYVGTVPVVASGALRVAAKPAAQGGGGPTPGPNGKSEQVQSLP